MANMYLIICKKENLLDLGRLNISCILADKYDKSQANNMFYQALYQILYNLL